MPSKLRISAIYTDGSANARYRAKLPLEAMARRGHKVIWPREDPRALLDEGKVPAWDVYHVQQWYGERDIAFARWLREHGIAVVWDTDDDILHIPKDTRRITDTAVAAG